MKPSNSNQEEPVPNPADSPFARYSLDEIRAGAANPELRKRKADKAIQEAAKAAVKEELLSIETRKELALAAGVPAEMLIPPEMTATEFQKWKQTELRKRVAAISRQASAYYKVLPADKAVFEHLAYSEFLLERVLESIIRKGLLDKLLPTGDAKHSEAMLMWQLYRDLSRQVKEQRESALMTRRSRQHQIIHENAQDAFALMANVRRTLLQRTQQTAIEAEVISDQALPAGP